MTLYRGSMWTTCLPLTQEWDRKLTTQPCVLGLRGDDWNCLSAPHRSNRSDRYDYTISCMGWLISSKGAYFPSSAFPLWLLATATPWWSDSTPLLPSSYQQTRCNMDKPNTCYSIGRSFCQCRVSGISLGFQLDALRLFAACCYVISQRGQIVCGTLILTQSEDFGCLVEFSGPLQPVQQ